MPATAQASHVTPLEGGEPPGLPAVRAGEASSLPAFPFLQGCQPLLAPSGRGKRRQSPPPCPARLTINRGVSGMPVNRRMPPIVRKEWVKTWQAHRKGLTEKVHTQCLDKGRPMSPPHAALRPCQEEACRLPRPASDRDFPTPPHAQPSSFLHRGGTGGAPQGPLSASLSGAQIASHMPGLIRPVQPGNQQGRQQVMPCPA